MLRYLVFARCYHCLGRTVFVLQTRVLWQEGEHVDFMSTKVKLTWLQNLCTLLKTTHHR